MGATAGKTVVIGKDRLAELETEVARLRQENTGLAQEVERLEGQVLGHEFHVLGGYIVIVYPVGDGTYIAACPTLHASVQEPSVAEAVRSLQEAARIVKEAHGRSGRALPPKDVVARCLD